MYSILLVFKLSKRYEIIGLPYILINAFGLLYPFSLNRFPTPPIGIIIIIILLCNILHNIYFLN